MKVEVSLSLVRSNVVAMLRCLFACYSQILVSLLVACLASISVSNGCIFAVVDIVVVCCSMLAVGQTNGEQFAILTKHKCENK